MTDIKAVQEKLLEIMKYIDRLCRQNGIVYYIMGGTALGAVRHGGFIPWDDDIDIFMTPEEYGKFKAAFTSDDPDKFVIQEWRAVPDYLEYAKVRMNGTTFIEHSFLDRTDLHQGIYIDIMILHKVPENRLIQSVVYFESKFVTLHSLSLRNWKPKTAWRKLALGVMNSLPKRAAISTRFYRRIYKYDQMTEGFRYCYWISSVKLRNGSYDKTFFEAPVDFPFEDTLLYGSTHIKEYLTLNYGDYMTPPSPEQREAHIHAEYADVNEDYKTFLARIHDSEKTD